MKQALLDMVNIFEYMTNNVIMTNILQGHNDRGFKLLLRNQFRGEIIIVKNVPMENTTFGTLR